MSCNGHVAIDDYNGQVFYYVVCGCNYEYIEHPIQHLQKQKYKRMKIQHSQHVSCRLSYRNLIIGLVVIKNRQSMSMNEYKAIETLEETSGNIVSVGES